ncbi:PREDICTED: starch-binding domain-containing protein 1 [Chrysochloris asiatica]|uniref:Starch-binding domain-containing protein 1 n=1 Tax=Chrysochloris asiatica TaxID=185453 RepID=A0A9B0U3F1_CHRAS|nr:PREDICTED: starch-binding domain-containing protein 1 [Chrysochloris asiatica]
MGAVWSALLVGGSLAGALFTWLLWSGSSGGEQDGGGKSSPGQEQITKPSEHLQESNGCLISETKGLGNLGDLQEAAWRLKSSSGGDSDGDSSQEHVLSGQSLDTQSLTTLATGHSKGYIEVSKNDPIGEWGVQKGQQMPAKAATCFAEKLLSSNLLMDRTKEVSLPHSDSSELADQDDWEMVSRHSSWGDVGVGDSLEALLLSPSQGLDYGRDVREETRGQEVEVRTKRIARFPESQQVSVRFQIHYITGTGEQFIAVTGDHESLGRWKAYIPLQYDKDGFWSHSVSLPANTVVQWKFVVVENGEVTRWEECSNRFLETGLEDKMIEEWWGIL